MTKTLVSVNTASDTFQGFVDKTNLIITALANEVVTANATANGATTVGNGFVIGMFGANTLFGSTLRGGNLTNSGLLTITSNVLFNSILTVNNSIVIGNSTSNVNITQNAVTLGLVSVNSSALSIGNSTSNVIITSNGITNSPYISNNERTSVKVNNSVIGIRSDLNFIASGGASINATDNANNNSVDITISVSANGIVAGGNTQLQFNDSGSIAASNNLVFNKTNATLTTNNITTSTYNYKNSTNSKSSFITTNITSNAITVFDSFFISDYRGGEYLITVKDNTSNTFQLSKLLIMHDGITPYVTEYGGLYSNTNLCDFSATANTTHIILSILTGSSDNTIKALKQLIEA